MDSRGAGVVLDTACRWRNDCRAAERKEILSKGKGTYPGGGSLWGPAKGSGS